MSDKSKIEWTDATWNPIRGCTKISPGCHHCYASTFSERFKGVKGHAFEQGFDLRLVPEKLNEPLKWRTPKNIFVNSMSDLFHEGVGDYYIEQVVDVMMKANHHKFQVLTKRSSRMLALLNTKLKSASQASHIWLGFSAENRKHGVPRINDLRQSPATNKFVSFEPLLEDFSTGLNLAGISWMIVGGESGHGSRPFEIEWARNFIATGHQQNVRVFAKQIGRKPSLAGKPLKIKSYKGTDWSEWPKDIRVREMPLQSRLVTIQPMQPLVPSSPKTTARTVITPNVTAPTRIETAQAGLWLERVAAGKTIDAKHAKIIRSILQAA